MRPSTRVHVVYNFPKTMGVQDFCPLYAKRSQIPISKEHGAFPRSYTLVSAINI